ncbi:MAG: monovalent cation/H(+) antiporter subunit G [Pseudomonadota bacterium]
MDIILDIVSWAFILGGTVFLLIGGAGLVRFPDFYTRLHAAGITDTMASELLLVGMMIQAGFSLITVKLIIIGLFLFFTSPTATHAIANAAFVAGLKPHVNIEPAELEEDLSVAVETVAETTPQPNQAATREEIPS